MYALKYKRSNIMEENISEKLKKIKKENLKEFVTKEVVKLGVEKARIFINVAIKDKFNLSDDETAMLIRVLEKAEYNESIYQELEEEVPIMEIKASQDYTETEGLNYAVLGKNSKYIVTSKKNVIKFGDCEENGLKIKNESITASKLKPKTVVKFARDEKKVKISKIFDKIRKLLKKYIYFEKDCLYDVLTVWIMHTYVFEIFLYVPYLWLNGDKSSGKSLILSLISKLAFNTFPAVNVTEATLFRQVDRESSVLLLDEYEKAGAGINEAITQILNSGFYKEIAHVPRNIRVKDGDFETKVFCTFSPKVIAGISEISDVLADRTIKIKTKKIGKDIKLEKFSPTKEMEKDFLDVVQDLYLFGLTYANDIYEIYHSENLSKIEGISVREMDIWKPLLSIGTIIDDEAGTKVVDKLTEYAIVLNEEKRRKNLENNISYRLINALDEFIETGAKPSNLKDGKKEGYNIQKVFEFIKKTNEFEDIKTAQQLSKILNNNLDIKSERVYDIFGQRFRIYIFNRALIDDLKNRYNIEKTSD